MPSEYKPPEYKPPEKCLRTSISPGLIFGILQNIIIKNNSQAVIRQVKISACRTINKYFSISKCFPQCNTNQNALCKNKNFWLYINRSELWNAIIIGLFYNFDQLLYSDTYSIISRHTTSYYLCRAWPNRRS